MYFINMHNLLFVDDYHQIISLESQSDAQCKVNIMNVMYFIRLRFSQQTQLGHPNIHTYGYWVSIVADIQKKLASISLKIWIWDVHRLVAHVTIAYLHLLYLLCLGRPLPLSLLASVSLFRGLPLTVKLATRQNCSPHAKTGQGTEVAQRTFRLTVFLSLSLFPSALPKCLQCHAPIPGWVFLS